MLILTAVAAISGLTILLATALVLANKKLYVYEDPRIDVVEEMLPHANCGACGFPGCRPFAEALTQGQALPGKCTVSSDEERGAIADVPRCGRGRRGEARGALGLRRRHQRGPQPRSLPRAEQSCRAAAKVAGGGKGCFWGCLGLGGLRRGLRLRRHPHERAKSAGGGRGQMHSLRRLCRRVPEGPVFSAQAESPLVGGLQLARGRGRAPRRLRGRLYDLRPVRNGCAEGLISMRRNLPVVDYERPHETRTPIERCPTGAIVWIDAEAGPVKGPAAKKIIRKGTRREAPT